MSDSNLDPYGWLKWAKTCSSSWRAEAIIPIKPAVWCRWYCRNCESIFEVMDDPHKDACPKCGAKGWRVVQR